MTTYFLQTVPGSDHSGLSTRERLKISVHNTGNYFFEAAVARQLRDYDSVADLGDLPEDAETLVLSMSNFISPATDLGWLAEAIESTQVKRVVMIGAGAQAPSYSHDVEVTPGTLRFLSLLSDRSESIGVRGYFTAEVLSKLGIKNVEVIGCPSMFYQCDRGFRVQKRPLESRNPRVAIHCTPLGYYRDAISHLLGLGVKNGYDYVAQSEPALLFDEESLERRRYFFQYFKAPDHAPEEAEAWMQAHVRWFFDLESWFDHMRRMDFVVGSRFHGNMAALQAGVPALNLVSDSRTRELCEFLSLPFEFLKDFDGRSTAQDMYDRTDFSYFNANFARKYDAYRRFLEANGLAHCLDGSSEDFDDVSGAVRLAGVVDVLKGVGAGVPMERIVQELIRRIELDRSDWVMKLAEGGKFDVRNEGVSSV